MKKLLTIITTLTLMLSAQAQQAKDYFTSMPDTILPILTEVNRADCIDFLDSNMKAEVTNRFSGKSEMTKLTADFIEMRLTPSATWQMKVLQAAETPLVCAVSTVSAPAADSHILFYDDDWNQLSATDYLSEMPQIDDFFTTIPDSVNLNRYLFYRSRVDVPLMKAVLSPDAQTLSFSLSTIGTLDRETVDFLQPFVRKEIVYQWNGARFVKP